MTQRLVVVGAILWALAIGVRAQQPNPLLGVWELNLPKSNFNHDATPLGERGPTKNARVAASGLT